MEDISHYITEFKNKSKFKSSCGIFLTLKQYFLKPKTCLECTGIKKANTNFTLLTLVSPRCTSTGYYYFIYIICHKFQYCDYSSLNWLNLFFHVCRRQFSGQCQETRVTGKPRNLFVLGEDFCFLPCFQGV